MARSRPLMRRGRACDLPFNKGRFWPLADILFSCDILSVVMPAHSRSKNGVLCTPMSRASTSFLEVKNVDARHKAGHDERVVVLGICIVMAGLVPAIHVFRMRRACRQLAQIFVQMHLDFIPIG